MNLPLPFVHLAWTIDREENKLNKKAAVAILMCAVMVLVAAAPLAMSVSDHAHHVVKSTKGPRWDAVTWGFTPPSLGIWKGQITNNGLFWILVDVNDNTTGVPESIMHQRIQFIGDKMLFPTGAIDTQGAVMNNHHTYEITITPQGKIGTSCDVKDTFKLGVAPVAAIDVTSIIDLNVTVDGSRSYDPDGEIMGYMWDFGDRFIESESIECVVTGVTAKHTYAMAGTYDITLVVVDNDGITAEAVQRVSLETVPTVPPVLDPIGAKTVNEMTLLTFTATATDADTPVQTLTFSLSGTVPAGASITSAGVFTWTPTEAQGPGDYTFNVVVSDGSQTDSETITVHVNEVNVAPVLGAIGAKTVNELALLTFTATATDADIPVQTLAYSLSGTVPAGASITSAGVFTWTPTEAQGPGDYTFTVVVSDGSLTASQSVSVRVNEVNVAPVLAPIGNKVVDEMSLLTFTATATDADIPVQTLTFSLSGTVPAGASITSAGVFTWTPTEAQGPGDYTFNVVVSDGALTASETITVHVNEDNAPTASFTWTVSGLTVNVDASLSSDDKGIVSYVWSWGDGTTGTGKTATHTYTAPAPAPRAIVSAPIALAPGPPYLLWGYTTDALGTPYECYVTITNLRTGQVGTTDSFQVDPWPLDGYYEFDLQNGLPSAYLVGDMIKVDVVSVSGTMTGSNQAAVPGGPSMNIDVTLTGGTPQPFDRIITLTVTDIKGQTSTISKTVTLYP